MLEIDRNPTPRRLAWFGLTLAGVSLGAGLVLRLRAGLPDAGWLAWGAGAALCLIYASAPAVRRPLYVGWQALFLPAGWLVAHLVLAAIFFVVVTPVGVMLRLAGHDPLDLRRRRSSGWLPRTTRNDPGAYFRRF